MRRWQSLLLDQRFQLKYTAMILLVAGMISAALGSVVYQTMSENTRLIALDGPFAQSVSVFDDATMFVLAVGTLIFMLTLGLGSVILTHRIAGPIHVMQRALETIGTDALPTMRALRRGDELHGLHGALCSAVERLEGRTRSDVEVMTAALGALEDLSSDEARAAHAALHDLVEAKRQMLSSADA